MAKHRLFHAVIALCAVLALAKPGHAQRLQAGQPLSPAELAAFVDRTVTAAMAHEHIAGVTLSIVQHGQVVMEKGYGVAQLSPKRVVDPKTTPFRIGSISKTFTWIALMQQVEAGRMRLSAPVDDYLPDDLKLGKSELGTVRVIDLMNHAAGFEDRIFGTLMLRNVDELRPLHRFLRDARPARVHPVGAVVSYSNYGVALAGQAIAQVLGQDFETLTEKRIFEPLGMRSTTFREPRIARKDLPLPMPAALAAQTSRGFVWTPSGYETRPFEYIGHCAPAGSAWSTADDMARYMLMLLGEGTLETTRLYGAATAKAFRTPTREVPAGMMTVQHGFFGGTQPNGHYTYGHSGASMYFFSSMFLYPDLGLGIFIAANTPSGPALTNSLPSALVNEFYAGLWPPALSDAAALAKLADRFEGTYLGTRRAYSGLEGFIHRLGLSTRSVRVTADGLLTLNGMQGEIATLVPEDEPLKGLFRARSADLRVFFEMHDGRATALITAAEKLERVSWLHSLSTFASLLMLTLLSAIITLASWARKRALASDTPFLRSMAMLQLTQAALWTLSLLSFALLAPKGGDPAEFVYGWPHLELTIFSTCALLASLLTTLSLLLTPWLWRAAPSPTWSRRRKATFTLTALISAAFASVLALWGALVPWA